MLRAGIGRDEPADRGGGGVKRWSRQESNLQNAFAASEGRSGYRRASLRRPTRYRIIADSSGGVCQFRHGTMCRPSTGLLFNPQLHGAGPFFQRSTIKRMEEKPAHGYRVARAVDGRGQKKEEKPGEPSVLSRPGRVVPVLVSRNICPPGNVMTLAIRREPVLPWLSEFTALLCGPDRTSSFPRTPRQSTPRAASTPGTGSSGAIAVA